MAPVADLTESQIDVLLREAEERLAAKNDAQVVVASKPFELAVAKASKKEAATAAGSVPAGKADTSAVKKTDGIQLRIASLDKPKDKVSSFYFIFWTFLYFSLHYTPIKR